MTNHRFPYCLLPAIALLAVFASPAAFAQGPLPDAPTPDAASAPPVAVTPATTAAESQHNFWDRENKILFAGVVASHCADLAVTYTNLQSGGRELNPVVRVFGRSFAGLAANFAGESVGTATLSYLFHKTGHHKMERAISMFDIGMSTGAATYGLKHR